MSKVIAMGMSADEFKKDDIVNIQENGTLIGSPRHKHDCKICTFLGRYGDFDLYHHEDEKLIARFSDKGAYISCRIKEVKMESKYYAGELYEAEKRRVINILSGLFTITTANVKIKNGNITKRVTRIDVGDIK